MYFVSNWSTAGRGRKDWTAPLHHTCCVLGKIFDFGKVPDALVEDRLVVSEGAEIAFSVVRSSSANRGES